MHSLFLFLLLLLSSLCSAETVKEVGVTHRLFISSQPTETPYEVSEYVCVVHQRVETACGFVTKATATEAVIDLQFRSRNIEKGDPTRRTQNHEPCDPNVLYQKLPTANETNGKFDTPFYRECTEDETAKIYGFHLDHNNFIGVAMLVLSPRVNYERKLGRHFSLGATIDLISHGSPLPTYTASASGNSYGGHVYLNYYLHSVFNGPFLTVGIGTLRGRLKLRDRLRDWTGVSTVLSLGYRISTWNNYSVSLLGGIYEFKFSEDESPTPTYFAQPFLGIEFGVGF